MPRSSSTRVSLAFVASVLTLLTLSGVVLAAETRLSTQLQGGAAEVPPGDPDGAGNATVRLDPATGQACWQITVQNIAAATASHIHVGGPGVAGPVAVPLDTDGFTGSTEGCVTGQEAATLQSIIDNPGGHYVNVHTADFPGGAVRGQLAAAPPNTAVGGPALPTGLVALALVALLATLVGANLYAVRRAR